eukprot:6479052-Amphidinium_carterae.1
MEEPRRRLASIWAGRRDMLSARMTMRQHCTAHFLDMPTCYNFGFRSAVETMSVRTDQSSVMDVPVLSALEEFVVHLVCVGVHASAGLAPRFEENRYTHTVELMFADLVRLEETSVQQLTVLARCVIAMESPLFFFEFVESFQKIGNRHECSE